MSKKQTAILTLSLTALVASLLIIVGWNWYQQLKDADVGIQVDAPVFTTYHSEQNKTYCSPDGNEQKLDIHVPDNKNRIFPLIVYVHGGGWYTGSKDTAAVAQYMPEVARLGYVVAIINYRLAPDYTFPAQVQDTKCAIRYLRAHAEQYNIDSNNVGIIGESAGGYLAAFAGVTGNSVTYKTAEYAQHSDSVQAAVNLFGPSNFVSTQASPQAIRMARTFLGSANPTEASTVTHITKQAAPLLIVHGKDDTTVPYSQSQTLHEALQKAGVNTTLIPVTDAGHGLSATTPGKTIDPSLTIIRQEITTFLAAHLKN